MSLEIKRLQVQLANVTAARMANELKIDEYLDTIERIKKDLQISFAKENELNQLINEKKGE